MNLPQIKKVLSEAFEAGYEGKLSEEEVVNKLTSGYVEPEIPKEPENTFRIYNVEELRITPVGTKFEHSELGKCEICSDGIELFMSFDNPLLKIKICFNYQDHPWTRPMRKL